MATCFVCGKSGFLLFRCSNPSCAKVFCTDCGQGFAKANCPACGNRRGESAGLLADLGNVAREANAKREAEAAAAAAAAEQRRIRASQERMEAEVRAANEERLALERKRLEIEQARQAEDKRQRDQAAHVRRLTSSVTEFTEKVTASLERPETAGSSREGQRVDPTTQALSGAVCEILGQMISHQYLGDTASSNPYFTPEDLQQLTRLQSRIDNLHAKSACPDFVLAIIELLEEATSRCSRSCGQISSLLGCWYQAGEAYINAIAMTIDTLRVEWYLLLHFHRRSQAIKDVHSQVLDYCSSHRNKIDSAIQGVDLSAIESFWPDAARVSTALGSFKSALDAYVQQSQGLVEQSRELLRSLESHISQGGVIVPKATAPSNAPIDIGTLGVMGAHNAFLKFRRPLALENLVCSPAMSLFLNVAEDVASGEIHVPQSGAIGKAYASFMKAVTDIDVLLSKLKAFPQQVKDRLSVASDTHRAVVDVMKADSVSTITAEVHGTIALAKLELTRSEELARMGDLTFGERLRDRASRKSKSLLSTRTVDAAIADQREKLEAVEASFAKVIDVANRRATGLRGFVSEMFSDNSAGELRASLEEFFRHMVATRWGPGTELCDKFCRRVQQARALCAEMGYRPSLRAWVLLHDAVRSTQRREICPTGAFVNALCAMAAAHDAIDDKEAAAIHKAVKARRVVIEEPHVDELIGEWNTVVAEKRLLSAVAQAVVDVAAITDATMLDELNEELKNVARADDNLNDTEISVYHAFLTAITRHMHADLLSA